MKLAAAALLATSPAMAHVLSMSTGDLVIRGAQAHYALHMPLYEIAHVANPRESLFAHIRFSSAGRDARLLNGSCRPAPAQGDYVCEADYQFAAPVDSLDVECTFQAVTVPTHVHLLRAENNGRHDQSAFDISFQRATMRFRPPSAIETAAVQTGAGFLRALGGPVQILFLAGLAVAARSRTELLLLAGVS